MADARGHPGIGRIARPARAEVFTVPRYEIGAQCHFGKWPDLHTTVTTTALRVYCVIGAHVFWVMARLTTTTTRHRTIRLCQKVYRRMVFTKVITAQRSCHIQHFDHNAQQHNNNATQRQLQVSKVLQLYGMRVSKCADTSKFGSQVKLASDW